MYEVGNATTTTSTVNGVTTTAMTSPVWNTVGHAVVGCASSYASGGSCGSGAMAGGFSAAWGRGCVKTHEESVKIIQILCQRCKQDPSSTVI